MLAYSRHLAYGEDTGFPGASYLWKETRSSPLHDGKAMQETGVGHMTDTGRAWPFQPVCSEGMFLERDH